MERRARRSWPDLAAGGRQLRQPRQPPRARRHARISQQGGRQVTDHEVFEFLAYRWDITRAWKIADRLPVRKFNAEPWFGWLGLIEIDEDHLASADLDRPIMVVKIREAGGSPLIADGYARPDTVR
jgi:hypothetical protein